MANPDLRVAMLLALVSSVCLGQTKQPTIQQKSDKSVCANIVALTGDVNLKCSSLTPEQSKLLAKIPTLLNKILANQGDSKVLLDKMDEMIEAISRLNQAAAQPPTINYAPGGFATSGGTLYNPQVNNFRDPLPPHRGFATYSNRPATEARPCYNSPIQSAPGSIPTGSTQFSAGDFRHSHGQRAISQPSFCG